MGVKTTTGGVAPGPARGLCGLGGRRRVWFRSALEIKMLGLFPGMNAAGTTLPACEPDLHLPKSATGSPRNLEGRCLHGIRLGHDLGPPQNQLRQLVPVAPTRPGGLKNEHRNTVLTDKPALCTLTLSKGIPGKHGPVLFLPQCIQPHRVLNRRSESVPNVANLSKHLARKLSPAGLHQNRRPTGRQILVDEEIQWEAFARWLS